MIGSLWSCVPVYVNGERPRIDVIRVQMRRVSVRSYEISENSIFHTFASF